MDGRAGGPGTGRHRCFPVDGTSIIRLCGAAGRTFQLSGHALAANNHGFQSPLSYPYAPAPGEYVVGILGGSVAAGLAYVVAFTGTIAKRLGASPALRGRRVVVLNLAIAGFKQPRQLAVLGYFIAAGQKLDAVVSIDGVNELVSGSRNLARDVDETVPPIDVLGPFCSMLEGRMLLMTSTR